MRVRGGARTGILGRARGGRLRIRFSIGPRGGRGSRPARPSLPWRAGGRASTHTFPPPVRRGAARAGLRGGTALLRGEVASLPACTAAAPAMATQRGLREANSTSTQTGTACALRPRRWPADVPVPRGAWCVVARGQLPAAPRPRPSLTRAPPLPLSRWLCARVFVFVCTFVFAFAFLVRGCACERRRDVRANGAPRLISGVGRSRNHFAAPQQRSASGPYVGRATPSWRRGRRQKADDQCEVRRRRTGQHNAWPRPPGCRRAGGGEWGRV